MLSLAGLLTYSGLSGAFPFTFEEWPMPKPLMELTAAGTVADLHGIPFSSPKRGTKDGANIELILLGR